MNSQKERLKNEIVLLHVCIDTIKKHKEDCDDNSGIRTCNNIIDHFRSDIKLNMDLLEALK